MAAYRTGCYKQGSTSFRDSCWQEMVRYFVKSYMAASGNDPNCRVRPRFMFANPLTLLRKAEDIFGKPWKEVGPVDWAMLLSWIALWLVSWNGRTPIRWTSGRTHLPALGSSTTSPSQSGFSTATGKPTCFPPRIRTATLHCCSTCDQLG